MSDETPATKDTARQRVAAEMDWWRDRLLDKVKIERNGRDYLLESEILLCGVLAAAALREMSKRTTNVSNK